MDARKLAVIMFTDMVGYSKKVGTDEDVALRLLAEQNAILEEQVRIYSGNVIKTIGDSYMAAAGVPMARPDEAEAAAEMALAMQRQIGRFDGAAGHPMRLRIGMDTGPVIAGVISTAKLAYDLWGQTVSSAAQMQSSSLPGATQVTDTTYRKLQDKYHFEQRGEYYVKGKGTVSTYLLTGRRAEH